MNDTWGIPGPTFLAYYLIALAAITVIAVIHRRIATRGDRTARLEHLGPQQIAWLNGGDRLAVYSAMGGLRAAGALGSGPNRTLVQTGPLPLGTTPLDSAIYQAAARGLRARDVHQDQWVRTAVTQLRDGLEAHGLAVGSDKAREIRLWALGAGALLAVGVARLFAGIANDKPVLFLVPCLVLAVIITIALAKRPRPATAAARRGMREVRTRHQYLAPSSSPAYATYGAAGAAMGVALFGAASLYDLDPAFAAEAEVQRIAAAGGSSAGSSCGSGSSCGGSSSCGGGGGCGGGGCGG